MGWRGIADKLQHRSQRLLSLLVAHGRLLHGGMASAEDAGLNASFVEEVASQIEEELRRCSLLHQLIWRGMAIPDSPKEKKE